MKNNIIVSVLVTLVVGGGIGFYAGMKYTSSSVSTAQAQAGQFQRGGGTGRGGRAGGGIVSGQILTKDASSITVQLLSNQNDATPAGSKIVFLSGTTQVMKAAQGSVSDLSIGDQVTVMGSANSDGSVTAQTVQIRPKTSASSTDATGAQPVR